MGTLVKNTEGINKGIVDIWEALQISSTLLTSANNMSSKIPRFNSSIPTLVQNIIDKLTGTTNQLDGFQDSIQGAAMALDEMDSSMIGMSTYTDPTTGLTFSSSGIIVTDIYNNEINYQELVNQLQNSDIHKDELEKVLLEMGIEREEAKKLAESYGSLHWYEDVGRVISQLSSSGAEVCSDFVGLFTGEASINDLLNSACEFRDEVVSTGAVIYSSVESGVAKVGEWLVVDGLSMILTGVASIGTGIYDGCQAIYGGITGNEWQSATKAMWNKEMDFVSRDLIGETNKQFYEGTEIGKLINEKSLLKYDSKGAQTIQNVSTKVTEIALATGATIITGGAAGPLVAAGLGFVEGTGKTAEKNFQKGDKNLSGVLTSYLGGVQTASEWYAIGSISSGIYSAIKKAPTTGMSIDAAKELSNTGWLKTTLKKTFLSKDALMNTYLDTGATIASNTIGLVNGEDITWKDYALGIGFAIGGNFLGDSISVWKDVKSVAPILIDVGDTNFYINHLKYFAKEGITYEDYLKNAGISIQKIGNNIELAEKLGDSKAYLWQKLIDLQNSSNLSPTAANEVLNIYNFYKDIPVGDIDIVDMANRISKYLTKDEVNKFLDISNNGITNIISSKYSYEQKASIFNYTKCGGFEINSWLNDTVSNNGIKTRDLYSNVSEIQDTISGFNGNKIFNSTQGDIMKELDSVIESAKYDDAYITYRGLTDLFNNKKKVDVKDLRYGDKINTAGYQSSSIIFDNNYGAAFDDHNIILEIIVPPKSGTAAYIENSAGITRYGQTEMIVKRNATMTVIGNPREKYINGIKKTIIPVVVQ